MYMKEVPQVPNTAAGDPPDTLEAIARALEARGSQMLIGMQGIETQEARALFAAAANPNPIKIALTLIDTGYVLTCRIDGTIFGAIAEELARLGYGQLTTIGDVAAALDIDISNYDEAREHIHNIGCWCMGEVVEARIVAGRIRALKHP